MALHARSTLLLWALPTFVTAQYGPGGRYGPGSNNNSPPSNFDPDNNFNPYSGRFGPQAGPASRHHVLIAHGILASLAFVLFFPLGSIIVRFGAFRHAWLIHGLFQLFAYIVYIAAFGLGVYMIHNLPVNLLDTYHPIIGIVVFVFLFFQPILGWAHHMRFTSAGKRTLISHIHLWLGRALITLGMINGGLGLLLASDAPAFTGFAPSRAQCIVYGVIAGVMWSAWVVAAVIGERRRAKTPRDVLAQKEVSDDSESGHSTIQRHGEQVEDRNSIMPPPYKENYGAYR